MAYKKKLDNDWSNIDSMKPNLRGSKNWNVKSIIIGFSAGFVFLFIMFSVLAVKEGQADAIPFILFQLALYGGGIGFVLCFIATQNNKSRKRRAKYIMESGEKYTAQIIEANYHIAAYDVKNDWYSLRVKCEKGEYPINDLYVDIPLQKLCRCFDSGAKIYVDIYVKGDTAFADFDTLRVIPAGDNTPET